MSKVILIIILLLININCFAISPLKPRIPTKRGNIEELSEPAPFPEIDFFDENNNKHLIEEFDGSVVILSMWATWCSICIKEFSELDKLQKKFRKKPIRILALSEDFKGIEPVKKFYDAANIKHLDIYIDEKNKIFNALHVTGLPTTFIINSEGNIVAKITGSIDWDSEEINNLLNKYSQSASKNYYKPRIIIDQSVAPENKEPPLDDQDEMADEGNVDEENLNILEKDEDNSEQIKSKKDVKNQILKKNNSKNLSLPESAIPEHAVTFIK
jgi:thiol-disulfide isomerase/thioredoxin